MEFVTEQQVTSVRNPQRRLMADFVEKVCNCGFSRGQRTGYCAFSGVRELKRF
jgi:hypothetical protein